MRNKIFILTEDLNFFYRINKELNKLNIPFIILNIDNKIPNVPSIILTTLDEYKKYEKLDEKILFLPYFKGSNFEEYLLRIISAYRVGFKKRYSSLIFSIDPGEKMGIMVFLDDYYLNSHCCFEKRELIKKIEYYTNFFQKENPEIIKLTFKLGRGHPVTEYLVQTIYKVFNNRKEIKTYLIDESKSSKIKLFQGKKEQKLTKDEVSALILALRDGIEVSESNFNFIFNQIKSKKWKKNDNTLEKIENFKKTIKFIRQIAYKILNGDISLSESINMIKEVNLNNNEKI